MNLYPPSKEAAATSTAATEGHESSPHRDHKEVVELWKEYAAAWAAVIGPRAILFQIIPVLTPLMTYTKIMTTSPWCVLDVPMPSLFDTYSYYRKVRREVYKRPNAISMDPTIK